MLPESEFPIKGDALRDWLRTAGQSVFTAFESGTDALTWLRDQGASIRTADFYDIRRQVLEIGKYQEQVSRVLESNLIPAAWHITDHGLELSEQFLYRLKVNGTDPATGEEISKFFAIKSGRQLTPGEAMDQLGDMLAGEEETYEIEVESMQVTAALARPDTFIH